MTRADLAQFLALVATLAAIAWSLSTWAIPAPSLAQSAGPLVLGAPAILWLVRRGS